MATRNMLGTYLKCADHVLTTCLQLATHMLGFNNLAYLALITKLSPYLSFPFNSLTWSAARSYPRSKRTFATHLSRLIKIDFRFPFLSGFQVTILFK